MSPAALVLAGGGVAGIAWEIGVLAGIRDTEPAVFDRIMAPDSTFVGTSAGSAVAAQLASGIPLDDLYATQLAEETAELGSDIDLAAFSASMAAATEGATSPDDARRRIGAFAIAAKTMDPATRRAVIEARLPHAAWGERRLLIAAVNAETGELKVFDRDSGVDLISAVGASCAVPGIWPTVVIDGVPYTDGGVRSIANADLAAGCDPVLLIAPSGEDGPLGPAISPEELAALGSARVLTIFADEASIVSFGANPLDPSTRPAAAAAGREVGRSQTAAVAALFG